jgi:hypothetical protein
MIFTAVLLYRAFVGVFVIFTVRTNGDDPHVMERAIHRRASSAPMDSLSDTAKVRLFAAAIRSTFFSQSSMPFRLSANVLCMTKEETECAPTSEQIAPSVRQALRRLLGGCPTVGTSVRLSLAVSAPVVRGDSATIFIHSVESMTGSDEINEQILRVRVPLLGGAVPRAVMIYHGQVTMEPRGALSLTADDSCTMVNQ